MSIFLSNRFWQLGDWHHWAIDFGRFGVQRWCANEDRCLTFRPTTHPVTLLRWKRPPRIS